MKAWIYILIAGLSAAVTLWVLRGRFSSKSTLPSLTPAELGTSSFDPERREKLLQRIGDINNFSIPRPLVTLEEFFEGNNDLGSIGYNLPNLTIPAKFHEYFREIRDRSDVDTVLVEVKDLENLEEWPSTDTVWIITSADPNDIRSWLPEKAAQDEILDGFDSTTKREPYKIPAGMRAVGLWWD